MKWVAYAKRTETSNHSNVEQTVRQSRYKEALNWWNEERNDNDILGYIMHSYIKMQRLVFISNRSSALNLTTKRKSMIDQSTNKDILEYKHKQAKAFTPPIGDICRKIEMIKSSLGESRQVSRVAENRLAKAQATIKANERAISICSREIEHHCCICGGIHVFGDHKPFQRKGCPRLASKIKSLKYLERAFEESKRSYSTCKKEYEQNMRQKKEKKAKISSSLIVALLEPNETEDGKE